MDNLRKILTGMVILLVVILAAGGLYLASMGGVNHGEPQAARNAGDKQNPDNGKQDNLYNDNSGKFDHAADPGQKAGSKGQAGNGNQQNSGQPGNGASGPAGAPVIVQIQPPKTDPGLYLEQLREKLKAVNEANSAIASNSSWHTTTPQQNGGTPSGNMNQLHQDFYKLGQDIASMEQNLNQLSDTIRDSKFQTPQQFSSSYPNNYNSYPYASNYPGYPYYPYQQAPIQLNQQNQQHQQNQQSGNQTHQGSISDNSNHSNMSGGQVNLGLLPEGLFNENSVRTVFTLILFGSVILGIVSVIGFLMSLFKPASVRPGINNNTSV